MPNASAIRHPPSAIHHSPSAIRHSPFINGFSFLEVLLALALFTLASAVLTTSLTTALTLRERGDAVDPGQHALRMAREQLLLEPSREDAERGSDFELPFGGRVRWRATIESAEIVNLFAVELTTQVEGAEGISPEEQVQQLVLLRPTWSDSAERTTLLDDKRRLIESQRAFSGRGLGGMR
jgi:general secretion pathway protein I